jgi:hypothetical protein
MFSLDRGEFLTLEHLVIVQQLAITASFVAVPLDPLRTRAAHVVKLWSIAAVHYDAYEFLLYERVSPGHCKNCKKVLDKFLQFLQWAR